MSNQSLQFWWRQPYDFCINSSLTTPTHNYICGEGAKTKWNSEHWGCHVLIGRLGTFKSPSQRTIIVIYSVSQLSRNETSPIGTFASRCLRPERLLQSTDFKGNHYFQISQWCDFRDVEFQVKGISFNAHKVIYVVTTKYSPTVVSKYKKLMTQSYLERARCGKDCRSDANKRI